MKSIFVLFVCFWSGVAVAQNIEYPYPVRYLALKSEGQQFRMAFMDVRPARANGRTAILFHGKNFNGYYWTGVIKALSNAGFRVVVPDQVGWGKSSFPDIHYGFPELADNNRKLLDSLGIDKVVVIGHSMGGMLATRFTLMYTQRVERLVLEDPIGLEDYKTFVPFTPLDTLIKQERSATYASYKKYQQTYYTEWKPAYEPLVAAQAAALSAPNFGQIAKVNALTYQMIYEQPVCYEFENVSVKTLLITGELDKTIVGKNKLTPEVAAQHGNYHALGKQISARIKNAEWIEFAGVGHIPHVQEPDHFNEVLLNFLK
jgi:pimeloyl-ACP methyl ester carboxylesterase